ncbi:MAG TPA: hypothetical protein VF752_05970 [Thermoleophilaceae bacterium]
MIIRKRVTNSTSPRRVLAAAAAVTAVAASSLAGAGGAQAARGMEVAVQDDAVFVNNSYYGRDNALDKAQALGATRIRVNAIWSRLAKNPNSSRRPSKREYHWAAIDDLIDSAAARGIRVQLSLTGPVPRWAAGDHRVGVYKPKAHEFALFANDAARHFKGRVDRYSIWNEPNWIGWLKPIASGPRMYRALFVSGYRAIKSADPGAKVLIGETAPRKRGRLSTGPLAFLRGVTCTDANWRRHGCSSLKADGYAHHPYAYEVSPTKVTGGRDDVTMATLGRLTHALAKLRANRALRTPGGASLYLTEYGYFTHGRHSLGTRRTSAYLKAGFRLGLRNRAVKQMLQYMLVSPPGGANWDTALLATNGNARSAYFSLKAWTNAAAAHNMIARPSGPIYLPPRPAS